MTTAYTTLLGFALPVEGELDGTWGNVVNNSITELVEDSIAATATASVTSGDWTLTTTGTGAVNQARCAILVPTGTPGVTRNIIAPSSSKAYIVDNKSDAAVVVKGSATTGTTIAAGARALVAWTGADFVTISTSTADGVTSVSGTGTVQGLTLSGTVTSTGSLTLGGSLSAVSLTSQVSGILPVANGGTGVNTLTGIVKASGTSAFSAAVSGTDYAPATSGTSILYGNGAGGFSNVTIGSGISFAGGTLSASGSGGTVTSVTASSPLASSGGATPNISFTGTLAVANGGTGASDAATARSNLSVPSNTGTGASGTWGINVTGYAASLSTTNFTVAEVGGKLVISYLGTPVLSITSAGVLTALSDVTANGTV